MFGYHWYQDAGIEDVVYPEDTSLRKRGLQEDEVGSPLKRRRVLSFAEVAVDDSEGDEGDFWLAGIEGIEKEIME